MSFIANHKESFIRLISQRERLIYKVCSIYLKDAEDRKDLFQEIVLQAWRAYPRFENRADAGTWLYRVALNTAITHQRKSRKIKLLEIDDYSFEDMGHWDNEEDEEKYKILYSLMAELPALEKALLLLYMEDKSYQEIGDIMGISPSNVGTRLNRIREKLRKMAAPVIQQ